MAKTRKILILDYFLAPGIEFLSKNTPEMVYFNNFERIFSGHFLTKMHIFAINRHLKIVGPPTIHLSRVKKSSLYLLAVTNDSVFKSAPFVLGHPVYICIVLYIIIHILLT